MATNPYFQPNIKSEQELYEDITIESLQMHGQDVYYIPRHSQGYDRVWSDDILPKYEDAYRLEMYIDNTEGFDGEGDLFSKFGVEIRDAASFTVSRRRFQTEVRNREEKEVDPDGHCEQVGQPKRYYRPREGDLIYLPMTQTTFQVMRCETQDPFFALHNLPIFKLSCEMYEYSNENFDTGIKEIDRVEEAFAYQWVMKMDEGGATGYIENETVTQLLGTGATMSGKIVKIDNVTHEVFVAHGGADDGKWHAFLDGVPLIGEKSQAAGLPIGVRELNNLYEHEMNQDLQDEVDSFKTPANFMDDDFRF